MIKLDDKSVIYSFKEYKNIDSSDVYFDFKNNRKRTKQLLKKFIAKKEYPSIIVINNYEKYVIDIFKAYYIKDERKRIEFIYDTITKELDNKWEKYSPCQFCHNKCIASRNGYMDKEYNGCCYSFKRKIFGKVKKIPCQFLGPDKRCLTSNISCKLFTCNYLKKNTSFFTKYEDYLLLTLFFNKKQRLVCKYNFFKKREDIIEKLLEKNHLPYFVYLFTLKFDINC